LLSARSGADAARLNRSSSGQGSRRSERVDVSDSASISTGIASRYATAVFELAKEQGNLDGLGTDIDALNGALSESEDFRSLISSPVYSRDELSSAASAVAKKMGLSGTMTNTLALMSEKRRLFVLPQLLGELSRLLADERGEVTAEVTAAKALTAEQEKKLAETLKARVGKDVNINMSVDESLIGGLIVKVGSRMIDTSIRSKLAALQNTMKEVG
jgi:F-type H+-transporting ATPase subunit delta